MTDTNERMTDEQIGNPLRPERIAEVEVFRWFSDHVTHVLNHDAFDFNECLRNLPRVRDAIREELNRSGFRKWHLDLAQNALNDAGVDEERTIDCVPTGAVHMRISWLRAERDQLRTNLAAAKERAEKAEELGNAHTEYTNRVLAERDTLRSENAAMREGLEDFKKHGTRHDASPTQASPWSNERWYEYCRSMDSRVREMAADTLARLTTQEGGEG